MSQIQVPKGWQLKKLTDGFDPRKEKWEPNGTNNLVSYVGLENIESNNGNLVKFQKSLSNSIKSSKNHFTKNDVLYGKLRPYLNKVLKPDFDGICSTDILVLKPKSNILRDYLWYFLRSPYVLDKISKITYGTKMPRTKIQDLEQIEFPIPKLYTQKKIVKKLDYILGQLEEKKEKILLNLENLKKIMAPIPPSFKNRIESKNNLILSIKNQIYLNAFTGILSENFRKNQIKYEPNWFKQVENQRTLIINELKRNSKKNYII